MLIMVNIAGYITYWTYFHTTNIEDNIVGAYCLPTTISNIRGPRCKLHHFYRVHNGVHKTSNLGKGSG